MTTINKQAKGVTGGGINLQPLNTTKAPVNPVYRMAFRPAYKGANTWNDQPHMRKQMQQHKEYDDRVERGVMQGYADMKKASGTAAKYHNQDVKSGSAKKWK